MDKESVYGASLSVKTFKEFVSNPKYSFKFIKKPQETKEEIKEYSSDIIDFLDKCQSDFTLDKESALFLDYLFQNNKKFNLEDCPTYIYSSGDVVDLLIDSKIGPAVEFRMIERSYMLWEKELLIVNFYNHS